MPTPIKLTALLTLESNSSTDLAVGKTYSVVKDGYRIVPLNVPMDLADVNYRYLGKAKVTKLVVTPESTEISFVVLKLFTPEEQEIFSRNFIKP